MFKAHLDAPNLSDLEKKYLTKAIDIGYVSTNGPFVPKFEEAFANYINAKRAVSLQSGTAALHMALYKLGIGKEDEVIVPSLTFIATINPILYVSAKPVIVDVDPETWNIDPVEIKKAVTSKTKAIIPVHLYGNPCYMDAIMGIAKERNLYVVEDATESLGATYRGKFTGTFGHFGCFSFNGNKLITTGGGGMIATDDKKRAEHIRFLVNQARDDSKGYYHPEMGFNYRMTNIEAALGLAQLERLGGFLEKKREFRRIYKETLSDLPYVSFQKELGKARGSWWLTCIKVDKEDINIDNLMQKLREKVIQTRRIFVPVSAMPYLRNYSKLCTNAYNIYKKGLCLPSSTLNSVGTIRKTAEMLKEILDE